MSFICALVPLCSAAVSLSYGGAASQVSLLLPLVLLPVFLRYWGKGRHILSPLCILSVIFRLMSLYTLAHGSLGVYGGIAAAVICCVISAVAAYKGNGALYFATPLFFITVLLSVYIFAVSFNSPLRQDFPPLHWPEAVAAVICPLTLSFSVSRICRVSPLKCFKSQLAGVALSSVFLLFGSAGAEFGFICVPLTVFASALEIKAAFFE